jgi:hypothetical protein
MVVFRGNNKFRGTLDAAGATKIGFCDYSLGAGLTYYVSNDGSDNNGGQNPNDPLLTMTYAISKCVASRYDAVVVMQESPSTATSGETFPLVVDKAGVLLTGLYSRGLISDSGFGADAVNEDCISISANHVAIENLYLQCYTGSSTSSVIGNAASSTARYGITIRNCWLGLQTSSLYCIYTGAAADWPYLLVEGCTFGAPNAANNTDAISLYNASFSVIRNNLFFGSSSYAIKLGTQCGNVSILDNKFKLYSDIDGAAIYASSGSSDNFVDGNHAMHGIADTTNDPYWDANGDDSNDWCLNYVGNDIEYPSNA